MPPFVSIGLTTFDRPELLRETLRSILAQTFDDYEVVIGNDNPASPLSSDRVGLSDPRLRFVNHPENLGELGNMNRLLEIGRGRYFTWLADDDLYAPRFLETVHQAVVAHGDLRCVFTAYRSGPDLETGWEEEKGEVHLFTGPEFLRRYLEREFPALGCYGVFERDCLREFGGMERLGDGFSPYSDNLLVVKTGTLDRLGYATAPLVFYRSHPGSISGTSGDVGAYIGAQKDLLRRSVEIFERVNSPRDAAMKLFLLVRWCLRDFRTVVSRAGRLRHDEAVIYARTLLPYVRRLSGSALYWRCLADVGRTVLRIGGDLAQRQLGC